MAGRSADIAHTCRLYSQNPFHAFQMRRQPRQVLSRSLLEPRTAPRRGNNQHAHDTNHTQRIRASQVAPFFGWARLGLVVLVTVGLLHAQYTRPTQTDLQEVVVLEHHAKRVVRDDLDLDGTDGSGRISTQVISLHQTRCAKAVAHRVLTHGDGQRVVLSDEADLHFARLDDVEGSRLVALPEDDVARRVLDRLRVLHRRRRVEHVAHAPVGPHLSSTMRRLRKLARFGENLTKPPDWQRP
mmetsp:Transcript_28118/g.60489  ORF Transcript_28118/g.60489 Transcript_28118/m.60489 type:complete len:241 (+) Transcript_28118:248-970(+)